MIFSSITFLFLYLPVVFLLYLLMPGTKAKNIFLTLASLIFYAWGEPTFVFVMLISVFINWRLGLMIGNTETKKTAYLIVAIVLNIGMLVYFKYMGFFMQIFGSIFLHGEISIPSITLPIGISFFTFQALSYVFDVKRGDVEAQRNYMDLLLYISLFPQLIAGPIVKYRDVNMQLQTRNINIDRMATGLRRFILGLSKKILIANQMAAIADGIFALDILQLNSFSTWIGAIAYTFQIYFDFSGYSDMAIGLGTMLGFDFKENFQYPLQATSIKDFWRRWHISLSTWFREFLYIPLGGNRKGAKRTYINQLIVFLATGLWHGANYTFILWGLFHGLFLVLETRGIISVDKWKFKPLKHIYTYVTVCTLFVLFRADTLTYGVTFIREMFLGFDFSIGYQAQVLCMLTPYVCFLTLCAIIGSTDVLKRIKDRLTANHKICGLSLPAIDTFSYVGVLILFIMDITFLASSAYNPFIYFRF